MITHDPCVTMRDYICIDDANMKIYFIFVFVKCLWNFSSTLRVFFDV